MYAWKWQFEHENDVLIVPIYGRYAQIFVLRCLQALFEREIFIQPWIHRAWCTHMWGNREYWSAAGSAGFGDLGFFKFSGKNMKLEWCRVDIFEGQGEGRTEGKKVIIFFEIPSAQKAANPQDWAHINWSLSIYAISLLWSENESIFTEWAPRSCHQVHITTYWAWRWVAILAMSALCQIWGPIALGQYLIIVS